MANAKPKSKSPRRKAASVKSRRSTATGGHKKRKTTCRPKKDVRERIHDLTLKALRDGDLTLRDIPKLAQHFIEETAVGLNNAAPQSSRNVLRQVVDGLTDAAEATARSTKNIVVSVTKRGSQFVKHDASRTVKDLRNLEEDFISALERAGKSLKGAAKDELDTIVRHSRRAGTRIKPAAQSVLKAADGRLLELGRETASASARAARSAVSTALHGASGFLQGLGEVVDKKRKSRTNKKSAKRT